MNDNAVQSWNYTLPNDEQPRSAYVNMYQLLLRRWNGYWQLEDSGPANWMEIAHSFEISHRKLMQMRQSREWGQAVTEFLNFLELDADNPTCRQVLGCSADHVAQVEEPVEEEINHNLMSDRKYGVEIEIVTNTSHEALAEAFSDADIPCQNEPWGSPTRSYWKTTTDSSIRRDDYEYAVEIVSPPLVGASGLSEIRKVCDVLKDVGASVNRSCGLHVHVDAEGLEARNIRNVVSAWMRYEIVIDSFLPPSRRRDNGHCYPLPKANHMILTGARSKRRVERLANPDGRYYKLNLKSLSKHGTIEFRHHSGTCEAEKIIRNVQFCLAFVECFMSSVYHPFGEGEFRLLEQTDAIMEIMCEHIESSEREAFCHYFKDRQQYFIARGREQERNRSAA